ncbi:J domain-containing protein, partial [Phocaeicola sp.]
MKNYYQVLGLNEDATQDEIKSAYKKYVVKFHPDKHNGDSFFKERFQEIQEAYDYLSKHYNENCSKESDTTCSNDLADDIEDVDFSCSPINIKEGEILTLNWNTNANCSISITIDNGYSIQNFSNLDQTGSKKIKINRLNRNIIATLNCSNKSSSICKTIY